MDDSKNINITLSSELESWINTNSTETVEDDDCTSTMCPWLGCDETFIYGYICLAVTIVGIIFNLINIVVLTRKCMVSSTNIILTGLAVSDMLVLLSSLPNILHAFLGLGVGSCNIQYIWVMVKLYCAHVMIISHTASIWLTVVVAIWRFMSVCITTPKLWRSEFRAKITIGTIYSVCIVFCVPMYAMHDVLKYYGRYYISLSKSIPRWFIFFTFWQFNVFAKIVPSLILIIVSVCLVTKICKARKIRHGLGIQACKSVKHGRVTKMILVILFIFLITNFPTGMLFYLLGSWGSIFANHFDMNYDERVNILILLNSSVNFIIYCSLSTEFQNALMSSIFKRRKIV